VSGAEDFPHSNNWMVRPKSVVPWSAMYLDLELKERFHSFNRKAQPLEESGFCVDRQTALKEIIEKCGIGLGSIMIIYGMKNENPPLNNHAFSPTFRSPVLALEMW